MFTLCLYSYAQGTEGDRLMRIHLLLIRRIMVGCLSGRFLSLNHRRSLGGTPPSIAALHAAYASLTLLERIISKY